MSMSDHTILTAAASVVAAAPSNVRNRLAAIARSSGTYRTVLLQMLQDAVGRRVADVEVVTATGELTEVGEEATRLAAAGLGDDAVVKVQQFNELASELGVANDRARPGSNDGSTSR